MAPTVYLPPQKQDFRAMKLEVPLLLFAVSRQLGQLLTCPPILFPLGCCQRASENSFKYNIERLKCMRLQSVKKSLEHNFLRQLKLSDIDFQK